MLQQHEEGRISLTATESVPQYLFGRRCQVLLSLFLLHKDLLLHVLGISGQAVGVEVVVALGLCEGFPLLRRGKGSFEGFLSTALCNLPS